MANNSIKRYSLSKQVADKLESMIENSVYKVDERIPTETVLMEMFSVSRNTVRESIQSLVSAGILEVRQGDGTYVISNNRFDATMSKKLESASYAEVNEARKTLEVSFASFAAERRTEEDLIRIQKALEERQQSHDSEKEHTLSDIRFHMEIASSCHNTVLLDLYKSLYTFLIDNISKRRSKTSLTNEEIDKYHEELYEAIKNKDSANAEAYAKKILNI